MKKQTLKYCTYHSCFISPKMAEKHGCEKKHNNKTCKYIVNIYKMKGKSL